MLLVDATAMQHVSEIHAQEVVVPALIVNVAVDDDDLEVDPSRNQAPAVLVVDISPTYPRLIRPTVYPEDAVALSEHIAKPQGHRLWYIRYDELLSCGVALDAPYMVNVDTPTLQPQYWDVSVERDSEKALNVLVDNQNDLSGCCKTDLPSSVLLLVLLLLLLKLPTSTDQPKLHFVPLSPPLNQPQTQIPFNSYWACTAPSLPLFSFSQ